MPNSQTMMRAVDGSVAASPWHVSALALGMTLLLAVGQSNAAAADTPSQDIVLQCNWATQNIAYRYTYPNSEATRTGPYTVDVDFQKNLADNTPFTVTDLGIEWNKTDTPQSKTVTTLNVFDGTMAATIDNGSSVFWSAGKCAIPPAFSAQIRQRMGK